MTPAGFYGKSPSRGDFVGRNLPGDLIEDWDAWAQSGLEASRAALGDEWLPSYLSAPIWRFATPSGAFGAAPIAGVVVPSVDRVGRYFPFLVATPLPYDATPAMALLHGQFWYAAAEVAALSALDESIGMDALEAAVSGLPCLDAPAIPAPTVSDHGDGVSVAMPPGFEDRSPTVLIAGLVGTRGLWWTQGGERVAACLRLMTPRPAAEAFTRLLIDPR
ncbi:MAG: type VI secretion system-associated protein TagF [Alphaproteobacteria bacterium]|nr:type VI secretion system-associated protein TagF [Alphaproteobacteria bacterium]